MGVAVAETRGDKHGDGNTHPRPRRCEACQFWARNQENETVGECRRSAPRVTMDADDQNHGSAIWPMTVYFDWCGEWVRG